MWASIGRGVFGNYVMGGLLHFQNQPFGIIRFYCRDISFICCNDPLTISIMKIKD